MFCKCQLPKVTPFLCYAIFIFKMYLGETPFLSKEKLCGLQIQLTHTLCFP